MAIQPRHIDQKNGDWVKRQLTFKTSKNTRQVLLYLDNEQPAPHKGKGTIWYDNVQFEKGSVASSYNPVVNSSLKSTMEHFRLAGCAQVIPR